MKRNIKRITTTIVSVAFMLITNMSATTSVSAQVTITTSEKNPDTSDVLATSTYEVGDVNHDGEINAIDSSTILMYAANTGVGNETYICTNADVNNDGEINATDSSLILVYASTKGAGGYMAWPPVEEPNPGETTTPESTTEVSETTTTESEETTTTTTETTTTETTTSTHTYETFEAGTKFILITSGWNVYSDINLEVHANMWIGENETVEIMESIGDGIYKISFSRGIGYIFLDTQYFQLVTTSTETTTTETTTTETTTTETTTTETTTTPTRYIFIETSWRVYDINGNTIDYLSTGIIINVHAILSDGRYYISYEGNEGYINFNPNYFTLLEN